jgi:hypothetical protein
MKTPWIWIVSALAVLPAKLPSYRLRMRPGDLSAGRIRILRGGTLVQRPFLDIASRVLAAGERGLLGLTFHPRFSANGRFFVNYTRRADGATVISECLGESRRGATGHGAEAPHGIAAIRQP